jgi:hypothetical protein
MRPETDEQFLIAVKSIAGTFIDKFAAMGMAPNDVANLTGAALSEILAQQLGPFGAVERMRDMADVLEKQLLPVSQQGRQSTYLLPITVQTNRATSHMLPGGIGKISGRRIDDTSVPLI